MRKRKITTYMLPFLALVLALGSCQKEHDNDTNRIINQEIFNLMQEVYLWYDHLPSIDPGSYSNPYDLVDALRYKAFDRWSHVMTTTEYEQYFEEGTMIGHGFLASLDENENIRIAFVYRSTEAYEKGVRRSWIIKRINGTAVNSGNLFDLLGPSAIGIQNTIEFLNEQGNTEVLQLTKEEVNITPVLHYEVIDYENSKIGYLVFQDFIDAALPEIDEAFESFVSAGVDEIILDMRYNGGGSVSVAEYLAGWVLGKNHEGPFVSFRHNDKYAVWDTTINLISNPDGLELDRIFFIGTASTASASELMINGARPYMESILSGGTTHGKPVGMYVFPFDGFNYVVFPVTFKGVNADDEGDFYNGIPPDLPAVDDLSKGFGDPDEDCLAAILAYINTGQFAPKAFQISGKSTPIEKQGAIHEYLKAY